MHGNLSHIPQHDIIHIHIYIYIYIYIYMLIHIVYEYTHSRTENVITLNLAVEDHHP
jgi:hypothetical protein